MRLGHYAVRRILYLLPILIGVSLVAFVIGRVLPGNPVYMMVGPQADQATLDAMTRKWGFDRPLPEQYGVYVSSLVRGDLGTAWHTANPVTRDLRYRFPATFELSTVSLVLAVLISVPLGVMAAVRPGGGMDRSARFLTTAGVSVPQFWLGLILIYVLFFRLGWFPPPMGRLPPGVVAPPVVTGLMIIDALLAGNGAALWGALRSLALPSVTLAFAYQAPITRLTRSAMTAVVNSDYVRGALAVGVPRREVIFRYGLKNALSPVMTMIGMTYGFLLGGTVLVESVFAWPGMGMYAVSAMNHMDYAAVQGVVLVSAGIYMLLYLALDLFMFIIDPRIRA